MIAEMAQSQLLDASASVHDNDPATTDLLMQLFLSDLTPEEELNKLGCGLGVATTTPPTTLDVDCEQQSVISTVSSPTSSLATVPQLPSPSPLTDSGICSEAPSPSPIPGPTLTHTPQPHDHGNATICDDVISVLMSSASPLECTDSNGFSDPLDNPFLTESTDFSDFLQDPSVSAMLSSSHTPTPSPPPSTTNTVCNNDSDTTPFPLNLMSECGLSQSPSNTDVHVNVLDAPTHDSELNLFDLSQNPSLLPPSFDATEVENLDIDFSTFCVDTLSCLLPTPTPTTTTSSDNDNNITSDQLSVMLSQAQQLATSNSSTIDSGPSSVSNSNCDDDFIESSPSPSTSSDQSSVTELSIKSPKTAKSRKRQASDLDSDTGDGESAAPAAKKTRLTRRQKNNVASQVSRAKRRAKNTAMFDRVGELESENAMLRIQEKELTDEIERLKSILVNRLSK